jgi:hypothetical protein
MKNSIFWNITARQPTFRRKREEGSIADLLGLFFGPSKYRRNVPPKRRLTFNVLHGVLARNLELLLRTAVRALNLTHYLNLRF